MHIAANPWLVSLFDIISRSAGGGGLSEESTAAHEQAFFTGGN
jgi:hypothetical protein